MKIALIGDIHANLPALETVLAHIAENKIEKIWNIGDFVGYGPFPNEVVRLFRTAQQLRGKDVLSIVGNYDLKALEFKHKKAKWRKKKHPLKYRAFQWANETLTKKNRKYLHFLTQEIRVKIKGHRVLLTHGSPASNTEHLSPSTPEKRLRKLAQTAKADLIVCGHSHQPFARQVDGVWFINPGSVGRPDDGDPRASFAILDLKPEQVHVEHHRLEYDVEQTVAAIHEHELPESFAQMFLRGRNLDVVLGE